MKTIIALLEQHKEVDDYKINVNKKESFELFFVKGKLETVRRTDTCDKLVTVYVRHGEYNGDSDFYVYPSTTEKELHSLIEKAVAKARLINNPNYELPAGEEGDFVVESNFAEYDMQELAFAVSELVFQANTVEHASLNSVEIFINKHTDMVRNSRGISKSQVRYSAMVEAIPTFNGDEQSVELYEQYNFSSFDKEELIQEIAGKMQEVKDRYRAVKPEEALAGNVILHKQELSQLCSNIIRNLNYGNVYAETNLFKKGDVIQKAPVGDLISIRMRGELPGNIRSAKFDADGMSLSSILVVDESKVVNYFGNSQYGQYLGETPTGSLGCMEVTAGTAKEEDFSAAPYLDVISMSGLQVDFHNDYIGGEIRLAYYHNGQERIPVTGISVSGSLKEVLNHIRLSENLATFGGYTGPEKAVLSQMKIF